MPEYLYNKCALSIDCGLLELHYEFGSLLMPIISKRPDIGQDDLRLDRLHHKSLHNNHYQCSLTYIYQNCHQQHQHILHSCASIVLPHCFRLSHALPLLSLFISCPPSFSSVVLPFHASIILSALWSVPSWLLCCAWCERLLLSEAGWINISSAGTSRSYQQREPLPSAHTSVSSSR